MAISKTRPTLGEVMKVAFVTNKYPPPDTLGATATFVEQIAEGLVDEGVQTYVLCRSPSRLETSGEHAEGTGSPEVYRITDTGLAFGYKARKILSRIVGPKDIVHLQDVLPIGAASLYPLAGLPQRKFTTLHGFESICRNVFLWPPASQVREQPITSRSPLCFSPELPSCSMCFGRGIRENLRRALFGLRRHLVIDFLRHFNLLAPSKATARIYTLLLSRPVHVLPNAVEDFADGLAPGSVIRRQLGWSSEDTCLFMGGRSVPEKGIDLLLRSLSLVVEDFPEVRLVITTKGRRQYLKLLSRIADRLGLMRVQWVPWLSKTDQLSLVKAADLVIVPTRGFEIQGMIAVEAEMLGKPLIVADTGGLVEVVESGVNGLIFRRDDEESLANALRELLLDQKRRRKMARQSRAIYQRRFTVKRHLEALLEIYSGASLETEIKTRSNL